MWPLPFPSFQAVTQKSTSISKDKELSEYYVLTFALFIICRMFAKYSVLFYLLDLLEIFRISPSTNIPQQLVVKNRK